MLKQNNYKGEKKKRIYSEEEQKILNIMKK
jgi:hypothetical protein